MPLARRAAFAAGLFTIMSGALVISGWISGTDPLKSIVGPIAMKSNMALSLIACGLALSMTAASARTGALPSRVPFALAAFAGVVGGLTLLEHLTGFDLHIDQLLFREPPSAPGTMSPGRMGPNGCVSLLLTSWALIECHRGTPRSIARAQFAAVGTSALALVALTGWLYGAQELYTIARFTAIAIPTALTFLVLNVGILLARVDRGPLSAIAGNGPGPLMARRLLLPAIAAPLLLGLLQLAGMRAEVYDAPLGTALLAIALAALLVALIWRTAEQVNAADRVKNDFLATLSHELRTPLNAIAGWTHMLRHGMLSTERAARALEVVANNARQQQALVEELLDMSRITAGQLRLEIGDVDLREIVRHVLDVVAPAAEAGKLTMSFEAATECAMCCGDRDRLHQVVANLVSNAVKFTPPGGAVSVRLDRAGGDLRLQVRDTGLGIDRAFLPHLFDQFRQADSSPTRTAGGLGLGLSIARHIVLLHGGRISAHSDGRGKGAMFTVYLPAADHAADGVRG